MEEKRGELNCIFHFGGKENDSGQWKYALGYLTKHITFDFVEGATYERHTDL